MEDGEYRASFGKTWPLILPPCFMFFLALWIILGPNGRSEGPLATLLVLFSAATMLAVVAIGFWVLKAEYLELSGDGLGYTQTGKPHWHLNWRDIRAVRVKSNASVESPSATVILEYDGGERKIRDSFLPIRGRELANEICRRSGAALSS